MPNCNAIEHNFVFVRTVSNSDNDNRINSEV